MMRRYVLVSLLAGAVPATGGAPHAREDAYRASNRGVAQLEQFQHEEGVKSFQRALDLAPDLALARINLAIAYYNVPDLAAAEREAKAAAAASPKAPQPHYILGLIARSQNRVEDGLAELRLVLDFDPDDVGALVNLGQLLMQQRQFAEAAVAFRRASAAEPYNTTAVYNLGLALSRGGQADEGQKMMQRFQELRAAGYGTVLAQTYPDQGRYAEAVISTGAEPDLVDATTPAARFVDATAAMLPPQPSRAGREEGGVTPLPPLLFDYDGDGALDLFDGGPQPQRLYRNQDGRFVDVTQKAGLDPTLKGNGALAGDWDGDGRPDLLVLGTFPVFYRNGDKGFVDVSSSWLEPSPPARRVLVKNDPVVTAALADVDHDGDLDLILGHAFTPSRLFRNSGNGTFSDVTKAAGLAVDRDGAEVGLAQGTSAIVPTDYDSRRDMDLLLASSGAPPQLFRNLRNGTFRDVASELALPGALRYAAVAVADVNKDTFTDFFFGVADGPDQLALSDGKGGFVVGPAPLDSAASTSALFVDYDNDGLLDLVTISARGLRLLRNRGTSWADVTSTAVPEAAACARARLAAGDLDADGDTDLVLRLPNGALRVLRNDGGTLNHSLTIGLAGRVSNRNGIGSKIELRAGSLRQKAETSAAAPPVAPADLVFGLGSRPQADAVRVLWPSGVLQTELLEAPTAKRGSAARYDVKELDRKPSSCPYLYAWNGSRFDFITDFMGGGEMGNQPEPGVYNTPDPDEYVRLTDAQLKPKDGRYELRVTNELEEVLFLDRLSLLAVDHPADVEIYPNEGMLAPMPAFKLYAVGHLHPPLRALDDHGHDAGERLARVDRRFVDDFALSPIRGYAREHALALDLGPDSDVLLLNGWTDYAFSSDNVAAHQAGLVMRSPELQMRDARGAWQTVMPIGFPVGRPQTVVVDLAGKWLSASREVRIVTNMRIYWDQARAGVAVRDAALERRALPATRMDLRERGFSAAVSPDEREPFSFDYQRATSASDPRWKLFPGRYTRTGDVHELLASSDDLYLISRPGDEVALSFDATALSPPGAGRRRTFLLYADGFSKEMDINSATPDALGPLPFHGMTRYPYAPPEAYPMTDERRAVLERYTTRRVRAPLPLLETTVAAADRR